MTDSRLYVGRLIRRREPGSWQLLAFRHDDDSGGFIGEITDPQTAHWDGKQLCVPSASGGHWPGGRPVTAEEQLREDQTAPS